MIDYFIKYGKSSLLALQIYFSTKIEKLSQNNLN